MRAEGGDPRATEDPPLDDRALIREKVAQASGILREMDVDCWITFARESALNGDPILDFLVGSDVTWHTAIILTASGRRVAVVGEYDRKTIEDLGAYEKVVGYVKGYRDPVLEVLREIRPSRVALNYSASSEIADGLTHGMYLTLREILEEAGLADGILSAEAVISALRQRKTSTEIVRIQKAIDLAEEIFEKAEAFLAPGRTERQVASLMQDEARRRGVDLAWDAPTCPAVFTGPASAGAHYTPTDRAIERGHLVNMDFGVKWGGYASDLQRTYYVLAKGESEAPAAVKRGFDTLLDAVERARRAMKPGVRGLDIDTVARGRIVEAGYAEFPHALGHQVGRFAHDGTVLLGPAWEKYATKPMGVLEPGMVFTIEPRLTVPGHGVATVEEMVLVGAIGAEYLSRRQDRLRYVR